MATKILLKNSQTASAVPSTSDLDTGELAVNTADKRTFTNNSGTIVELGTNPSSVTTGAVTASSATISGNASVGGTLTLSTSPTSGSDAATKAYVDYVDALNVNKSGDSMTGNLNMSGFRITAVGTPIGSNDVTHKSYVDGQISSLIGGAPAALDTLNELAAALGDDANYATTVTTALAGKVAKAGDTMTGNLTMGSNAVTSTANPTTDDQLSRKGYVDTQDALKLNLSGGTMSGAIAMGTSKITGLGDPTLAQDAATKNYVDTTFVELSGDTLTGDLTMGANKVTSTATPTTDDTLTRKGYVDTQDALKLSLTGGTMTGTLDMGANKITTTYTPTDNADLTTKTYVDGILGSATAASASLADFDSVYQRSLSSPPALDRNGDALTAGDLYFDTTDNKMYVYDGLAWGEVAVAAADFVAVTGDTMTGNLDVGGTVTADDLIVQGGITEEYEAVTSTANATTVDLNNATNFSHTLTENTTFTFSNPATSGTTSSFTLKIVQDASASGFTVTWPTSVDWPSATAPTLTATASAVDYFVFTTHDGGTTWYGFTAGQAMG